MREFITAVEDAESEDSEEESYVEVPMVIQKRVKDPDTGESTVEEIDRRILKAYAPNPSQLTFMLAALGRGQTQDQRYASIVNVMLESFRDEDKDYLESRLLTNDKARRLPLKTLEEMLEDLIEEWFARPTQPPSDSVSLPQSDGQNSTPPTTK